MYTFISALVEYEVKPLKSCDIVSKQYQKFGKILSLYLAKPFSIQIFFR